MIRVESLSWGYQDVINKGLSGWHPNQANSAGGVSVKALVVNYGKKAVKKYTVYFVAYDGANEIVECETTRKSIQGVKSADRVSPSCPQSILAENLWYSHAIRRVEVSRIDVVYTDGTTESCKGNYVLNAEEQKEADRWNKNAKKGCLIWFIITVIICLVILAFFIPSLIKGISYM